VLIVLSAPLASLTVGLALDHAGVEKVLLPSAAIGLVVCALASWLAPGVIPTGGVFYAGAMTVAGLGERMESVPTVVVVLVVAMLAAGWTVLAPRLTATPIVASSLGLLALVADGFAATQYTADLVGYDQHGNPVFAEPTWGADAVVPLGYGILLAVAVVGVTCYLRGGSWPWVAGAGLAAAAFVGALTGDRLGTVAAFFGAGVVLLGSSAVLLVRAGRHDRQPDR